MHSKTETLTDTELEAVEKDRDLGADLLMSINEMKAGKGHVVWPPALAARQKTALTQVPLAELLGVSVRTLQRWKQKRKN